MKIENKRKFFLKYFWKVSLFALLADIIGLAGGAVLGNFFWVFNSKYGFENLHGVFSVVLISAVISFFFNRRFVFKSFDKDQKTKFSAVSAAASAPYVFLLPSSMSYLHPEQFLYVLLFTAVFISAAVLLTLAVWFIKKGKSAVLKTVLVIISVFIFLSVTASVWRGSVKTISEISAFDSGVLRSQDFSEADSKIVFESFGIPDEEYIEVQQLYYYKNYIHGSLTGVSGTTRIFVPTENAEDFRAKLSERFAEKTVPEKREYIAGGEHFTEYAEGGWTIQKYYENSDGADIRVYEYKRQKYAVFVFAQYGSYDHNTRSLENTYLDKRIESLFRTGFFRLMMYN